MLINGLGTRKEDAAVRNDPRITFRVFKGMRQTGKGESTRPGADLKDRFRIETKDRRLREIITLYYRDVEVTSDGDFLLPSINVFLWGDKLEHTFTSFMAVHSTSGRELLCDRETITERTVIHTDKEGNKWRRKKQVKEKCPLAETPGWDCPNKCQKHGRLIVGLAEACSEPEFYDSFGVLSVHGFSDLEEIPIQLAHWAQVITGNPDRECAASSPYTYSPTQGHIPYIMTRMPKDIKVPILEEASPGSRKKVRTGKKRDKETYSVLIYPEPNFVRAIHLWRQREQIEAAGLRLTPQSEMNLIYGSTEPLQIVEGEVVDVESSPVAEVPAPVEAKEEVAIAIVDPLDFPERATWISRIRQLQNQLALHRKLTEKEQPNLQRLTKEELLDLGTRLNQAIPVKQQVIPAKQNDEK